MQQRAAASVKAWSEKMAAGFVGYGGLGGARAIENLRLILVLSITDWKYEKIEFCSGFVQG